MKILVISNLYPPDSLGGYELGCRQAVAALRAAGHDVLVLTTGPRSRPVPPEEGVHRRLKLVDVYDPYCKWKSGPAVRAVHNQEAFGVHAFNVHVLTEAVESFRPDVAYVWNLVGVGGLGLLATLQLVGVPWVMHLMDNVLGELCGLDRDRPVIPELAAAFVRVCRGRFLCCSQTTLNEIGRAGVPIDDRTRLVPNWVVTDGSPPRTDYLPGGHLRVVSAGAMATFKGVDLIIRATGLARDRGHANVSVDLYGHGTDPQFELLIRRLGLQGQVTVRGPRTQEQLYDLYPRYDVFAFPTWEREPFGFAPLEAMAHGVVAVASRVCGFSEWFVHGVDCVKVERTPEALADAFVQALRGDLPVAEIGRRGAQLARRRHHITRVLPVIEAELRAAARAGGGPARTAAEACRLALLAEKSFQSLLFEAAA